MRRSQSILHAPWPTRVPDVTTVNWDQAAWDTFAESFRPKGYTGDIRDYPAYEAWAEQERVRREAELRADFYGKHEDK